MSIFQAEELQYASDDTARLQARTDLLRGVAQILALTDEAHWLHKVGLRP